MGSMVKWGFMDRGTLFWPISGREDAYDTSSLPFFYPERIIWQLKPYMAYSESFYSYERNAAMVTNAYNHLAYIISFSDGSKLRLLRIHAEIKNGFFSGKIMNGTMIAYQDDPESGPYDVQYFGQNLPAETVTVTNDISGAGFSSATIDPEGNITIGAYSYGGSGFLLDFSGYYYAA